MTRGKALRLALGVALAGLFLWLIFRQTSMDELVLAFTDASTMWIVAALLAFGVGYACRIQRWRLMLQRENPELSWRQCAGPLLASFATNNVLPFRAGDVLRTFAFNRQLGASSGVVIATLFVERLLDLLMVLVLLGAALAGFGISAQRFAGLGSAVLVGAAAAILALLLFPRFVAPAALAAGRLAARLAPRVGVRLLTEITKSLATLDQLAKGNTMVKLLAWSLAAWLAEGCVFWFAAVSLPSISTPLAGWLALPVGTLATLIPSTPGYVGTFDFFTARAMAELGNSAGGAAAFTLLVHAVLWVPTTLAGSLYMLLSHVRQQARHKATSP